MNAPAKEIERFHKTEGSPAASSCATDGKRIAIHAVAREAIFWETIEKLKAVGASSILVLPIEKIVA